MKTIKYEVTKFENGREEWRVNGKYHREDGPAFKWADGSEEWYKNGDLHREDGPAIKYSSGYEAWYKNGEYHREDGPAIKWANGKVEYWIEGKKFTKEQFESRFNTSNTCDGKVVEIEGVKYKLTKL